MHLLLCLVYMYPACSCLARLFLFTQSQHCTHSLNIYYPSYTILDQSDANCICYMINMNGRNGEGISYGVQRRANMTRRRRSDYGPEWSEEAWGCRDTWRHFFMDSCRQVQERCSRSCQRPIISMIYDALIHMLAKKERNDQVIKKINTLGRMYTPRNWDFKNIICSIARSASRFVSIYLAGITGRNISSAETYTKGRALLGSTPAGEAINASHTRKADFKKCMSLNNATRDIFRVTGKVNFSPESRFMTL